MFSPLCLGWLILLLLSVSWGATSISKFWLIVSIIILSAASPLTSLIPCTRRQFLLEYSFCWSACFSSFETLLDKVLTSDWRLPIISSFFYYFIFFKFTDNDLNTEELKREGHQRVLANEDGQIFGRYSTVINCRGWRFIFKV